MVNTGPGYLLFVEPASAAMSEPIIDGLTRGMAALLASAKSGSGYHKDTHRCACGAMSGGRSLVLADGTVTNSLAVHYLAYHRAEVPRGELSKLAVLLRMLGTEPAEPTAGQLSGPDSRRLRAHAQPPG